MLTSPFPPAQPAVDQAVARIRRLTVAQLTQLADEAANTDLLEAICILTRGASLAEGELVRSSYVELFDRIEPALDDKLVTGLGLCGAARCCMIGSLYVAGNAPMRLTAGSSVTLDGIEQDERTDFLRNHPALELAYEALNFTAWERYDADPDLTPAQLQTCWWHSMAEALFEGSGLSTEEAPSLFRDARELLLNELSQRSVRRQDTRTIEHARAAVAATVLSDDEPF